MGAQGSVTRLIIDLRSDEPAVREVAARLVWGRYFQELLALARNHLSARVRRREDEEDVFQSMYKSFCVRQRRGDFDLANRDELWNMLVRITLRKARNAANRHLQGRGTFAARTPTQRRMTPTGTGWSRSSTGSTRTGPRPPRPPCSTRPWSSASRCSRTPACGRSPSGSSRVHQPGDRQAARVHAPDRRAEAGTDPGYWERRSTRLSGAGDPGGESGSDPRNFAAALSSDGPAHSPLYQVGTRRDTPSVAESERSSSSPITWAPEETEMSPIQAGERPGSTSWPIASSPTGNGAATGPASRTIWPVSRLPGAPRCWGSSSASSVSCVSRPARPRARRVPRAVPRRSPRSPPPSASRSARTRPDPAAGRRPEPALRPAGPPEQLHRPRRPAGGLQCLGRRQVQSLGQILLDRGASPRRDTPFSKSWSRSTSSSTAATPSAAWPSCRRSRVRDRLEEIADLDLQSSLMSVSLPTPRRDDPDAESTATWGEDSAETDAEGRFQIVRFHDRGAPRRGLPRPRQQLHRIVALKRIKHAQAADQNKCARFVVEAEITGRLEHPGIVPVYSLGTFDDGRPFYAMRFIRGDNLKTAIERFHQDEQAGRDPGERTLALLKLLRRFLDVCNAIAYAHSRGVLHRDLKPGNIMLGKFGETLVVDWGLAKSVGRPEPVPASATLDDRTLVPQSGSDLRGTERGGGWGRRPT